MEENIRKKTFIFTCEKCGQESQIDYTEYDDTIIEIAYAPCQHCNHVNHFFDMPSQEELQHINELFEEIQSSGKN